MKPNIQFYIINVALKIGMIITLILNNYDYLSLGYYHFLLLYGTTCFLITCFFEYNRKNYILTALAFIGLITYQPIYSVLKESVENISVGEQEVYTYSIIRQSTFITVILWIIFDLVRGVKYYRNKETNDYKFDTDGIVNTSETKKLLEQTKIQEIAASARLLQIMRKLYNNPKLSQEQLALRLQAIKDRQEAQAAEFLGSFSELMAAYAKLGIYKVGVYKFGDMIADIRDNFGNDFVSENIDALKYAYALTRSNASDEDTDKFDDDKAVRAYIANQSGKPTAEVEQPVIALLTAASNRLLKFFQKKYNNPDITEQQMKDKIQKVKSWKEAKEKL